MKTDKFKIIIAGSRYNNDIKKIMTTTWLATYPNKEYGISREDILEFWKRRKQNKRKPPQGKNIKKWVTIIDNKVVGYCIVEQNKKFNEIGAIYILPKYQKKGVGKDFIKKVLKYFGEEKEIRVFVVLYNKGAIDFYKNFGFKEDGRFKKRKQIILGEKNMPLLELVKRFKNV